MTKAETRFWALALTVGMIAPMAYGGVVIETESVITRPASKTMTDPITINGSYKSEGVMIRNDAEATSTISNTETGDEIVVQHSLKKYTKVSGAEIKGREEKLEAARAARTGGAATKPPVKLEATGKKETISGFEAQAYVAKLARGTVTVWMTTQGPDAKAMRKVIAETYGKDAVEGKHKRVDMTDVAGFPVRIEVDTPPREETDAEGKVKKTSGLRTVTTIVVAREEKLDAGLFKPPAGYEEIKGK